MFSASEIAKLILQKTDFEKGEVFTNLKLQKLLYYLQGFHLAMYDKALFKEDILAWQYGPVVKEVYDEYKIFEDGVISKIDKDFHLNFDESIRELVDEVYEVYGQYSALKLMEMTHSEAPWLSVAINEVIPHSILKEYFAQQLISE